MRHWSLAVDCRLSAAVRDRATTINSGRQCRVALFLWDIPRMQALESGTVCTLVPGMSNSGKGTESEVVNDQRLTTNDQGLTTDPNISNPPATSRLKCRRVRRIVLASARACMSVEAGCMRRDVPPCSCSSGRLQEHAVALSRSGAPQDWQWQGS